MRVPAADGGRPGPIYLHLPLVAGVVLFAVGAHAAVEHVDVALRPLPMVALSGGIGLFYLADVAYRWRDRHQLATDRMVTGAAAILVYPAAAHAPAIATLVVLTAIGVARLSWELWRRPRIGPTTAGTVQFAIHSGVHKQTRPAATDFAIRVTAAQAVIRLVV